MYDRCPAVRIKQRVNVYITFTFLMSVKRRLPLNIGLERQASKSIKIKDLFEQKEYFRNRWKSKHTAQYR